ncbi:MAG: hypothetical protein JW804_03150 [Sedimentisphaerales bacterium]|nr:hypothetical protein [Sedimentisphaerales bacterium]
MNKKLIAFGIITAAFGILLLVGTTEGVEKTVEVQTYSLPEYRSETDRAIDAYQQMINRLLDSNEHSTTGIQSIEARLTKIEASLARIEKHLGIKEPAPAKPVAEKSKDNISEESR